MGTTRHWISTRGLVILGIICLLTTSCVPAEARVARKRIDTVPTTRWARMTSGVNMPYWMSHLPFQTLPQMKQWTDTGEMKVMRQMGVRHVRLPFIPEAVCKSYSPVVIDEEKMAFVRQVLTDYRRNDILVVLDLHAGERLTARMKNNPEEVQKLKKFWQAIAGRLKDLDPEFLMFEILNEPNMDDRNQWWSIQRMLLSEIRAIAPQHTVVVESDRWSGVDEMLTRTPYQDPNVIYAFHFYEPFIFTHQGASWVEKELGGWRNVKYPSDDSNDDQLRRQVDSTRKGEIFDEFTRERWGPARIKKRVKLMADWAKRYNVKVICNEFGTMRGPVPPANRGAWFRDCRRAFEDNGIGWTVYEWRGGMGMVTDRINTPAGYSSIDWPMLNGLGFEPPPVPK